MRCLAPAILLLVAGCVDDRVNNADRYQAPPNAATATLIGEGLNIGYVDGVKAERGEQLMVEAGVRTVNVFRNDMNGSRWKNFKHRFIAGHTYVLSPDFTDGFGVSVEDRTGDPKTVVR